MNKTFTDGYKGRIGLVATAPGNATEADFNSYRPKGVAVMTTRTPLSASTPEGILKMNKYTDEAARMLAGNAFCDVILLSSTAGSFVEGLKEDLKHTEQLSRELKCPVISSATCMKKALDTLKIHAITLLTPSSAELNQAELNFLSESGKKVLSTGSFLLKQPRDILCVKPDAIRALIKEKDIPETEGILISCSGLHVMEYISDWEEEFQKPILASNQFGLWGCLKQLGLGTYGIPGTLGTY